MVPFRNVLVDVDASAPRHPALDTAADLAQRCGAKLTVAAVIAHVPPEARRFVTPRVERELVAHYQEHLAAIRADLRRQSVEADTVLLRGRAAAALVGDVVRAGRDLLIRAHGRADQPGGTEPFGSVDLELLRVCPCPVWIVKASPTHRIARIAAAVHASPDDPEEQRLNAKIVELARGVADLESASLTLVQAWVAFGEPLLGSRLPHGEFEGYVDEARRAASDDLAALVRTIGPAAGHARIALVRGEAEDAIDGFVRTHEIDLVVMGTVARTGLPGLLIGNTADRILNRLRCSVLAIKPDGFRLPSRPDAAV